MTRWPRRLQARCPLPRPSSFTGSYPVWDCVMLLTRSALRRGAPQENKHVHITSRATHRPRRVARLRRYLPRYGDLLAEYLNDFQVEGGYISAWGSSGIADPKSGLHSRAEIGVTSLPRFHSVNTGKYVMAPKYGEMAALRVLSELGGSL